MKEVNSTNGRLRILETDIPVDESLKVVALN